MSTSVFKYSDDPTVLYLLGKKYVFNKFFKLHLSQRAVSYLCAKIPNGIYGIKYMKCTKYGKTFGKVQVKYNIIKGDSCNNLKVPIHKALLLHT